MLIIRQIFHISTHCFSCAFAIDRCLISQPFIGSLFFFVVREVFFLLPPHITVYMLVAAIVLLWLLKAGMRLTSCFFCGAPLFFDFRRFLARLPFVCVVFPVLAANTHFYFNPSPMSRGCSDVFQLFFQRFMWNIVVFSMIYCLFTVCFLRYPRRYSVAFFALFFWFLRVDTRFYAACTPIVYYWHLLGVDVVA